MDINCPEYSDDTVFCLECKEIKTCAELKNRIRDMKQFVHDYENKTLPDGTDNELIDWCYNETKHSFEILESKGLQV